MSFLPGLLGAAFLGAAFLSKLSGEKRKEERKRIIIGKNISFLLLCHSLLSSFLSFLLYFTIYPYIILSFFLFYPFYIILLLSPYIISFLFSLILLLIKNLREQNLREEWHKVFAVFDGKMRSSLDSMDKVFEELRSVLSDYERIKGHLEAYRDKVASLINKAHEMGKYVPIKLVGRCRKLYEINKEVKKIVKDFLGFKLGEDITLSEVVDCVRWVKELEIVGEGQAVSLDVLLTVSKMKRFHDRLKDIKEEVEVLERRVKERINYLSIIRERYESVLRKETLHKKVKERVKAIENTLSLLRPIEDELGEIKGKIDETEEEIKGMVNVYVTDFLAGFEREDEEVLNKVREKYESVNELVTDRLRAIEKNLASIEKSVSSIEETIPYEETVPYGDEETTQR